MPHENSFPVLKFLFRSLKANFLLLRLSEAGAAGEFGYKLLYKYLADFKSLFLNPESLCLILIILNLVGEGRRE